LTNPPLLTHHFSVQFAVLGSGSSGNATLAQSLETTLLIDAGLSAKQLLSRALTLGNQHIDAILITHEHSDHVKGLKTLLKQRPIPVYASSATAHVLRDAGLQATWHTFEPGQAFHIGSFEVGTFRILHDAVDPVGYVLRSHQKSLGLISDAGHVTHDVTHHLQGVQGLYLEANYDEELLAADTKRPWTIKQRISSRHGHLSNRQAADLLDTISHDALKHVVLGHLSSDCNCQTIATRTMKEVLARKGLTHIPITCATQDHPTPWHQI
jgi:phosphoribosyl 1,2-cyclic phosphodiesterase